MLIFFFFTSSLGTNDHNCTPSIFSPSGFFYSKTAAGYNLKYWSQLCKWAYPRLTNDLLSQLTFVYSMQITSRFQNMPENVNTFKLTLYDHKNLSDSLPPHERVPDLTKK